MKTLPLAGLLLCAATSLTSAENPLDLEDLDFDADPNTAWSTFNNALPNEGAPGIDFAIEGSQTLKMFGNFTGQLNFSGAFRDIPVDGSMLAIGDHIQLSGQLMHLSADALADATVTAFLEITFVDSGGNEFGFGDNTSESLTSGDPTDSWVPVLTPDPVIPPQAVSVRIKAVFQQEAESVAGGAAWIDGLCLQVTKKVTPPKILSIDKEGLSVTLTWESDAAQTYSIRISPDGQNWEGDLGDNVAAQGDITTETVDIPAQFGRMLLLRVEENAQN